MLIKNKIIWMLVSCLMVLSLVIASCGQKEAEEAQVTETSGQVVTTKEKEVEEEKSELEKEGTEMAELNLTKLDGTKITKTV